MSRRRDIPEGVWRPIASQARKEIAPSAVLAMRKDPLRAFVAVKRRA
jgi:hypothetical protein